MRGNAMFDTMLFGYNKQQVEDKIHSLYLKINKQQQDLDYLRNENKKLKTIANSLNDSEMER